MNRYVAIYGGARFQSRVWCALVVLSAVGAVPLSAQAPSQPSALFGALPFPNPDVLNEFGVVLDRFTDSTKRSDWQDYLNVPQACKDYGKGTGKTCRYALDRVIGFSSIYGSFSKRIRSMHGVARVMPLLGYTGNEPTQFFQNNFLHNRASYDKVDWSPGKVFKSVQASLGADFNTWIDRRAQFDTRKTKFALTLPAFIGIGGTVGTIANDAYIQLGVRDAEFSVADCPIFSVSGMVRSAFLVRPGFVIAERRGADDQTMGSHSVYPSGTIGRTYSVSAVALKLRFDRIAPLHGLMPALEIGNSWSSFFVLRDPNRLALYERGRQDLANEHFNTIAATWVNGDFGIETWNDAAGNKDQGPSYGARMFVRWRPERP